MMWVPDSENIKAELERGPTGKRPSGRLKNQRMVWIKQDLEKLRIVNWQDKVHNRKKWRKFVVAVKILEKL